MCAVHKKLITGMNLLTGHFTDACRDQRVSVALFKNAFPCLTETSLSSVFYVVFVFCLSFVNKETFDTSFVKEMYAQVPCFSLYICPCLPIQMCFYDQ